MSRTNDLAADQPVQIALYVRGSTSLRGEVHLVTLGESAHTWHGGDPMAEQSRTDRTDRTDTQLPVCESSSQLVADVVSGVVVQAGSVGGIHLPPHEVPIPQQLPAAGRYFVGRSDELAQLTAALDSSAQRGGTVLISALAAAGGIGKTALALHWAHQNLDQFPDGQLFVDLRGFSPAGSPVEPAAAVRGFLDAFEVDPGRIPADLQAQTGLYRSLVAGKRMLIVLDNAANVEQVVPLLPGSTTCTVIATSRRRLAGLAVAHGARLLDLDVLPETHAKLEF